MHERLEQVDIISLVNTNTLQILSLPGVPPEAIPPAAAAHQTQNSYEFIIKPQAWLCNHPKMAIKTQEAVRLCSLKNNTWC
jgi:hypothetical protein